MLYSLIAPGWRIIVEKFEANMFKAITSSPFNFMSVMKSFTDAMSGGGGKDGGQSDNMMQKALDGMKSIFPES